ncbi:hypothetical protein CANARDRAFT_199428 [[Candida] arabinofermentans NRRL YB-2248]|uniref:tRNA (guanine(10)-N(2))-methyltransferase n=1 Tax=[Candida] arabinofermentans NRRL YB-2248 TaxID=983967 RepID=A0A1E4T0Q6_9ASCO|nr:hypothetical protein CANARDRAFT_199428 [[Candida] arabinofermentans NRRL YB-2248]
MKEYLIYLAQSHTNFRKAELESLAELHNIKVDLSTHDESSPFMIVKLENDQDAYNLISRSILSKGIYEVWGTGNNLEELHESIQKESKQYWDTYMNTSFKFDNISYQGGKKSRNEQLSLFESFSYLAFQGLIKMKKPDQVFVILENYDIIDKKPSPKPNKMYFGRQINLSARSNGILDEYEISKRPYYGTTTFDAELALLTCNISQIKKGQITYDPFVGTGSFLVSAGYFGSLTFGSDIDFRSLKGKKLKNGRLIDNFKKYNTLNMFGDVLCMDFTNNSFRSNFKFDNIICDPPYGIREGLKVCGTNNEIRMKGKENVIIDGELAYLRRDYVQPKKTYSLDLLLDDLLKFSGERLNIGGRLSFWMPVANDEDIPTLIPHHENLELTFNLVQDFNKWSRRLLVYVKRDDSYRGRTVTIDDRLVSNNFRDRYFTGFSPNKRDQGR